MLNLTEPIHRRRLFRAIEHSYRKLRPFRQTRQELVEQYVGDTYGDDGTYTRDVRRKYVNLLFQTADAYMLALAANAPRVTVSTHFNQLKPFRYRFQEAMNKLIQEIRLADVLRRAVLDAFFCIGPVKVYPGDSSYVTVADDISIDPGRPYADNVSLDDFVFDAYARSYKRIQFAGDSYRVPVHRVHEEAGGLYDAKVAKLIRATSKFEDAHDGDQRVEEVSMGRDTDDDEFVPQVTLLDVWIPATQQIATFAKQSHHGFESELPPLTVRPWDGTESGPYKMLSFSEVPDNIMPSSPASHLIHLDRLANSLMRKAANQASRQKVVTAYEPSADQDADRVRRAKDGDMIKVGNLEAIKQFTHGGVDPMNNQFLIGTMDLFDRMAGNLKHMIGLGPAAETLGQEQMISGQVSQREMKMREMVLAFTQDVCETLGWMMWVDEALYMPQEMEVGVATIKLDWTPEQRDGDFVDYNFAVEPYSMAYQSPQQRLMVIQQYLQLVGGFGEMFLQQGGYIDFQRLTEVYAELADAPRIPDIIKFQAPPQDPRPGPEGEPPGKPDHTSREYIRRNVSGQTPEGRNHVMQQALMGAAGGSPQLNSDQMRTISKPV